MSQPRKRLFARLDATDCPKAIELDRDTAHYLGTVLRLSAGSELEVIDTESNSAFIATVVSENRGFALRLEQPLELPKMPVSRVRSLCFALTKGKRNDLVCEKACELGVENILFWQAERSVVRIASQKDLEAKKERLERVAQGAAQQCRRPTLPRIEILGGAPDLINFLDKLSYENDCFFCCSLDNSAEELRKLHPEPAFAHLLIGPEGDLSEEETKALIDHGFQLLSLGPLTLRAETAAIAAVAHTQSYWGFADPK